MSVVVAHIATSPALSFDIEPWPPVSGIPLRPIQDARQTSIRADSISVATSASTCCTRCWSSSGSPSSTLPSRYSSVHSYAAWAMPSADAPTSGRVSSKVASAFDDRPVDSPERARSSLRCSLS
jgi:hypothetical protein